MLPSGHYVILSSSWHSAGAADAGAVTFGNASTGVSGVTARMSTRERSRADSTSGRVGAVSAANSLIGAANDGIGGGGVVALADGNYVVVSDEWDNGGIADVGAVTRCNGAIGTTGPVSAANSLIGSTTNDRVGGGGVTALANGNYVVASPNWTNAGVAAVGAVTWRHGAMMATGVVSAANSLMGASPNDRVGEVTALRKVLDTHYSRSRRVAR